MIWVGLWWFAVVCGISMDRQSPLRDSPYFSVKYYGNSRDFVSANPQMRTKFNLHFLTKKYYKLTITNYKKINCENLKTKILIIQDHAEIRI